MNCGIRHGDERPAAGAATTVVVLILPVVLLLVMLVVQFALAFHARQVVTAAAQDAAFAATAADAQPDTATVTASRVITAGGSGLVHDVNVTVDDNGDRVHVDVTATVTSVVPGFDLTVTGTAESPTERFRPQTSGG